VCSLGDGSDNPRRALLGTCRVDAKNPGMSHETPVIARIRGRPPRVAPDSDFDGTAARTVRGEPKCLLIVRRHDADPWRHDDSGRPMPVDGVRRASVRYLPPHRGRPILAADGGWRMADGGWRMADGGWRMAGAWWLGGGGRGVLRRSRWWEGAQLWGMGRVAGAGLRPGPGRTAGLRDWAGWGGALG
jgi:hypothetical protein